MDVFKSNERKARQHQNSNSRAKIAPVNRHGKLGRRGCESFCGMGGHLQGIETREAIQNISKEKQHGRKEDEKGNQVVKKLLARDGEIERRMREEVQSLQQQVIRQERLAAIGVLVSGVAHELNNPLQAILGFSELLQMRKDMPKEALADLSLIQKESTRASASRISGNFGRPFALPVCPFFHAGRKFCGFAISFDPRCSFGVFHPQSLAPHTAREHDGACGG